MTTTTHGDDNRTQPIPAAGVPVEVGRRPTLGAAPVPRRSPGAGYLGIVLAVLLLALGLLALYEGIVQAGWTDGAPPVLTEILQGPAVVGPHALTATVGVMLALLGLWLLWTALRPSGRTGFSLGGASGTWMTYGDLERIAVGTAEDCGGVLSARAHASRGRLAVQARTTTDDVRNTIRSTLEERLSGMSKRPDVVVRVEATSDRSGGAR